MQQMALICVLVAFFCLQQSLFFVLGEYCYGERSRRGFVLLNASYNSIITDGFPGCVDLCLNDPLCMSFNYWWNTKKCDLNNSTREICRACFVPEASSTYMGMGRYPGKTLF